MQFLSQSSKHTFFSSGESFTTYVLDVLNEGKHFFARAYLYIDCTISVHYDEINVLEKYIWCGENVLFIVSDTNDNIHKLYK